MLCVDLFSFVLEYFGEFRLYHFQIMKSEVMRIGHELTAQKEKIKENTEKIKVNKTLPYLVSNVIEVCALNLQNFVLEFKT